MEVKKFIKALKQIGIDSYFGVPDSLMSDLSKYLEFENEENNVKKIAILGRPNSGKSTLINQLIGESRQIVGPEAGLTRDSIPLFFNWNSVNYQIWDTAGIRKTSNKIEEEGIKLSKNAIKSADIVIYLAEKESDFNKMPIIKRKKNIFVLNKIDLSDKKAPDGGFAISAKTKKNLKPLKEAISQSFLNLNQEELLSVNIRHLDLMKQAYKNVALISPGLISSNLELVAENLRNCDELLGEIYDPISSDDMLGKIFKKFCIGK